LISYETTRILEGEGEEVPLLFALDSVGPLWEPRPLANGVPFDEVMNLARVYHGAGASAAVDDSIFSDVDDADSFLRWLREPISSNGEHVVNRYLHSAYRARPDLQVSFPLPANAHALLVDWGHIGGVPEMGMNPDLLPTPSPAARRARRSVDPRHRSTPRRALARAFDGLDVALRGKVSALARRRQSRLLELASQMVLYYRAGPIDAPVVVLRSEEYRDDAQLARWHGVETGGVTEHFVEGTHESMMREPAVASTAAVVERYVTELQRRGAPFARAAR
jgi:hypothetical protein